MGKCDICGCELLPEDYGYKVQMKSLDSGMQFNIFCCNDCFYKHFRPGLIAIGDEIYKRVEKAVGDE